MILEPSVGLSTLEVAQDLTIRASPERVFEALIRRLTVDHQGAPDSPPLPMVLEPRPGGRWYRDLGESRGHLWGFVQSYRPPTLLEIFGPLFMSYPVAGHLIFRIEASSGSSSLSFRYTAFGLIRDDHRQGIEGGFGSLMVDVKRLAEA